MTRLLTLLVLSLLTATSSNRARPFDPEGLLRSYGATHKVSEGRRLMGHFWRLSVNPQKRHALGTRLYKLFSARLLTLSADREQLTEWLTPLMGERRHTPSLKSYLEQLMGAALKKMSASKKGIYNRDRTFEWALSHYVTLSGAGMERERWVESRLLSLIQDRLTGYPAGAAALALLRAWHTLSEKSGKEGLKRFANTALTQLRLLLKIYGDSSASDYQRFSSSLSLITESITLLGKSGQTSKEIVLMLMRGLMMPNLTTHAREALVRLDHPSLRGRSWDPRRLILLMAFGEPERTPMFPAKKSVAPKPWRALVPPATEKAACLANYARAAASRYYKELGQKTQNGPATSAFVRGLVAKHGAHVCAFATHSTRMKMSRWDDWQLIFIKTLVDMKAQSELEQLFTHLLNPGALMKHWVYSCRARAQMERAACIKNREHPCRLAKCSSADGTYEQAMSLPDYPQMIARSAMVTRSLINLKSPLLSQEKLLPLIAALKKLRDPIYAMELLRALPEEKLPEQSAKALLGLIVEGGKAVEWPIAYELQFSGVRREAYQRTGSIFFSLVRLHSPPNDLVVQDLACGKATSLKGYRTCARDQAGFREAEETLDKVRMCPCMRHMIIANYLGYVPQGKTPFARISARARVTAQVAADCKALLTRLQKGTAAKPLFGQCRPLSKIAPHEWNMKGSRRYRLLMEYGFQPGESLLQIGLTGSEQLRLTLLKRLFSLAPKSLQATLSAITPAQLADPLPRKKRRREFAPYILTPKQERSRQAYMKPHLKAALKLN